MIAFLTVLIILQVISIQELQDVFKRVLNKALTKEQLDAVVYHLDVDRDGKIQVDEAISIYKRLSQKEGAMLDDVVSP